MVNSMGKYASTAYIAGGISLIIFAAFVFFAKNNHPKKITWLFLSIGIICNTFSIVHMGESTKGVIWGFSIIYLALFFYIVLASFGISKKTGFCSLLAAVIIIIPLFFIGMGWSGDPDPLDRYDNVFDKDPNNWTEDEKEYVNDFFEWFDDQYDD